MNTEPEDVATWFPTYGLLITEQILNRFHIYLNHHDLVAATKDPNNAYYQLLRIPFKNILNGIILEQVADYRSYGKKLFIDYLISGVANEEQGAVILPAQSELELERQQLMSMNEVFEQQESAHYQLIAASQRDLIQLTRSSSIEDKQNEIELLIQPYLEKTEMIHQAFCQYRNQFYDLIVRCMELLRGLPNYKPDLTKQLKLRTRLNFNTEIGSR